MDELEKIKKLDIPASEKIKKINEIIEKRNKEITDRKKEIESVKKAEEEAKKKEIDQLVQERIEEEQLEREYEDNERIRKEETADLEDALKTVKSSATDTDESGIPYEFAERPIKELYNNAIGLYNEIVGNQGYMTQQGAKTLNNLQYAIAQKNDDIQKGIYNPVEEVVKQSNSIKAIIDKLTSLYTGGIKKANGIQLWH